MASSLTCSEAWSTVSPSNMASSLASNMASSQASNMASSLPSNMASSLASNMASSSLICSGTRSRVSSVLNRDAKQFGKEHMFDGREETCWSSDQGSGQWLTVEFPQLVSVSQLRVQFHGGFAGKTCRLEGCQRDGGDFTLISRFYPEDDNSLQSFLVLEEAPAAHRLRVVFEESADLFGRVIVYSLDVLGERS